MNAHTPRPRGRTTRARNVVLSLYDFTTLAVQPWAEAGYECHCFDIQHPEPPIRLDYLTGGSITVHNEDLFRAGMVEDMLGRFAGRVAFLIGFPPCTDLATSGARHFKRKEAERPGFQQEAAHHAMEVGRLGDRLRAPWFVENPVSCLSTIWRTRDWRFHPADYGGYLPVDDAHPFWPDYYPPRDAYRKETWIWGGQGFIMPRPSPVETSVQPGAWSLRGGKSEKTKRIRSATPRGFARAVFAENHIPTNPFDEPEEARLSEGWDRLMVSINQVGA